MLLLPVLTQLRPFMLYADVVPLPAAHYPSCFVFHISCQPAPSVEFQANARGSWNLPSRVRPRTNCTTVTRLCEVHWYQVIILPHFSLCLCLLFHPSISILYSSIRSFCMVLLGIHMSVELVYNSFSVCLFPIVDYILHIQK